VLLEQGVMKLYSITVFANVSTELKLLTGEYELSSFGYFQRGRYAINKSIDACVVQLPCSIIIVRLIDEEVG